MQPTEWIWWNGEWKRWNEATVHVSAHALHYGSSVFEGIRAYETSRGAALFRLPEHLRRFYDSARLLRMEMKIEPEELSEACVELVRRNRHGACYLRPLAFRGSGGLGVDGRKAPLEVVLLSFEWGSYLGDDAVEHGVDAAVSSWRRFSSNSFAPQGKIGGQYVNNQMITAQAQLDGYQEGIALDTNGQLSEGAGENLFLVRDGVISTPSGGSSILSGITRDSVIRLARDLGLEVRETTLGREALYLCDELFMTGTAAEITPVRSVDRIPVGSGKRGPITRRLQEAFFDLVSGRAPDVHGWLTHVAAAPVGCPEPAMALGG